MQDFVVNRAQRCISAWPCPWNRLRRDSSWPCSPLAADGIDNIQYYKIPHYVYGTVPLRTSDPSPYWNRSALSGKDVTQLAYELDNKLTHGISQDYYLEGESFNLCI